MKRSPFLIYDCTEGIANPTGCAPECQGDQPGKKRVNRWDAVTDGDWRSEIGQRGQHLNESRIYGATRRSTQYGYDKVCQ